MNRSVGKIRGYRVFCTDGEAGAVSDLYFDDQKWGVCYLIVETGTWLVRNSVLISPLSVQAVNWESQQIQLNIDLEQVRESPDIDRYQPISRQREAVYHSYYGYPYYWADSSVWAGSPIPAFERPASVEGPAENAPPSQQDSHLRSANEVIGYDVRANDGEIGQILDLLVNEKTWTIETVVIEDRKLPGRICHEVPTSSVTRLSWAESQVFVNISRAEVGRQ